MRFAVAQPDFYLVRLLILSVALWCWCGNSLSVKGQGSHRSLVSLQPALSAGNVPASRFSKERSWGFVGGGRIVLFPDARWSLYSEFYSQLDRLPVVQSDGRQTHEINTAMWSIGVNWKKVPCHDRRLSCLNVFTGLGELKRKLYAFQAVGDDLGQDKEVVKDMAFVIGLNVDHSISRVVKLKYEAASYMTPQGGFFSGVAKIYQHLMLRIGFVVDIESRG